MRPAIDSRLARGAGAWRDALESLTSEQRLVVVETLRAYEREMTE